MVLHKRVSPTDYSAAGYMANPTPSHPEPLDSDIVADTQEVGTVALESYVGLGHQPVLGSCQEDARSRRW